MKLLPLTIHRPTFTEDDYGNQVAGSYTDIPAKGRVLPSRSREVNFGQQTLIVDATGVLAASTDVRETDELTAGGKRYQVIGRFEVQRVSGKLSHIHVDLRAVS